MATARTLTKLAELVEAGPDLTPVELKFVFKNWDDASRKLQANAVKCVKDMPKIAPAVQVAFIEADERAVKAIGELLCVQAQELLFTHADYAADIPVMLKKAVLFTHIAEIVWKKLAGQAKRGELTKIVIRKLVARKDCPPQFAKIAGMETAKEQKRESVTRRTTPRPVEEVAVKRRPAKVVEVEDFDEDEDDEDDEPVRRVKRPVAPVAKAVKTSLVKRPRIDDDFTDTRKVGNAVRKVRRPV